MRCSLVHCGLPVSGGQLALAYLDVKKSPLFSEAADEKLVSAEELCDVLYSGLGETFSFDVNCDLTIKC